jgi:hypothetical protein
MKHNNKLNLCTLESGRFLDPSVSTRLSQDNQSSFKLWLSYYSIPRLRSLSAGCFLIRRDNRTFAGEPLCREQKPSRKSFSFFLAVWFKRASPAWSDSRPQPQGYALKKILSYSEQNIKKIFKLFRARLKNSSTSSTIIFWLTRNPSPPWRGRGGYPHAWMRGLSRVFL